VIKLQEGEARILSQYIYSLCGVNLDESKSYLLESRLADLLVSTGSRTFSDLYSKARADPSRAIARRMIDAVTTGETSFFRDSSPFDLLRHKLLPELIDRRKKAALPGRPISIKIWSAACSSGQEVYSIAILLKELLGDPARYSIRLLGTDISDQAVAAASYGMYNQIEAGRGLPQEQLRRYFNPTQGGWKVCDEIRALASFRMQNLMEDFAGLGRFDIILCRNVAIYFTEQDKARVFNRLEKSLEPEGALIIGSTESLAGICPQFEALRYLRSVYYRVKG
jgi:chemotaxis protein methyltransferase CheR